MISTMNGSQPRPAYFFGLVLTAFAANMQGLLNAWTRTGEARDLAFYLALAAHFLLIVQYAMRFIGVGLRYRIDNTVSGWVSSGFIALISYIAANAVGAPEWWIGLYAVLTLGAVVKDWELRNWAKRNMETELVRRFEDTAITEFVVSISFFTMSIIVNTTLGTSLGLEAGTAIKLVSFFALVVTIISLCVALSRARGLSVASETDTARGVAGPPSAGGGSE